MNNTSNPRLDFFRAHINQDMSASISPLGRWLNGIIRVAEPGRLVAEYQVRDELANPAGVLHGGAASAIHCEGRLVAANGKIIAKCATNLIQTSLKLI
jgi:hypothetical protein